MSIAVASFCGGFFLLERIEKEGLYQGQESWKHLNRRFRELLAESRKQKEQKSFEWQANHSRLLHNVGITGAYSEQWPGALETLNESLDFKIKSNAVSVTSLILSIEALGKANYVAGNFDCARTALDFAARDWVREESDECKQYARCMSYTGRVNLSMGNFKAADFCFQKAKSIFKKDEESDGVARLSLLLAESALKRGDLELAQTRIDEARPFLQEEWGPGYESYFSDDVALLKCLQGQIFASMPAGVGGKPGSTFDDGILLMKQAIEQSCKSYGADDVHTQNFRLNLADSYRKKGDFEKCLAQLSLIEAAFERINLPRHPLLNSVYKLHIEALSDTQNALKEEIRAKLKTIDSVTSKEGAKKADALAVRLNGIPKISKGRTFTDPWFLPISSQIIAWVFCGMFACAMACAAIAGRKGYSSGLWFILGVLFNFFAYLVVSILPTKDSESLEFAEDVAIISDARAGVFILSLMPLLCILLASIFFKPVPLRDFFVVVFMTSACCLVLFPPIWSFAIAKSKGRSPFIWSVIGLCTSILGLVALMLLPSGSNSPVDEVEMKNTPAESTMLVSSIIHMAAFLSVTANIAHSWMFHFEL